MALIVHKYGGTSMGSTERIRNVAKRVAKWARAGHQMVVVPSAMSGETNRLLGLAKDVSPAVQTPAVTRERMYLETMQQVYSNVTKVVVDSKQGSNLLYLPLDKIMQQTQGAAASGSSEAASTAAPATSAPASAPSVPDARARDTSRTRDRESR